MTCFASGLHFNHTSLRILDLAADLPLIPQLEGLTFYHYLMHQEIPTLSQTETSLLPSPSPPAATLTAETPTETNAAFPADSKPEPTIPPLPFVRITIPDYLGGIADLTGEMMRLAIGSVGKSLVMPSAEGQVKKGGEELPSIESIGKMVRDIKGGECSFFGAGQKLKLTAVLVDTEMDPLSPYCRWLGKKMTVLDQSLAKIESGAPSCSLPFLFPPPSLTLFSPSERT